MATRVREEQTAIGNDRSAYRHPRVAKSGLLLDDELTGNYSGPEVLLGESVVLLNVARA